MRLDHLADVVPGAEILGDGGVDVDDVVLDSRAVGAGALFCCVPGSVVDGHDFAAEAVERGAVALLVGRHLPLEVPQLLVPDPRAAVPTVAVELFDHPSRDLEVVGVTGTNGKTTTTHLIRNVLDTAGRRVEVLGTLSGPRTTPEAPDLQRRLASWRDGGVQAVAMEVSSHALALHRVDGTRFRVAVFTNLSRDHLDFHGTMESYFETKARLFSPDFADRAVVNRDSPYGRLLADTATIPTDTYGLDEVEDLELRATGTRFRWRGREIRLGLAGRFNVSNALAAAHAAAALGVDDDIVATGLSRPVTVPGRFEVVDAGQPYVVVVDFAHTPDGLDQLLAAAGELVGPTGRVAVVFGCGGERDRSKRPAMGEVAALRADRVVLTSDNSRGEETAAIIEAVTQGYDRAHPRRAEDLVVEPDRRAAIALALAEAGDGDVVIVAGKGHETTQVIGSDVVPFDDAVVVRDELHRLGYPGEAR